ncbi:DUF1214 domain-containing protein [Prosthecomicrobium sp. N25]|uniref:DUF1214 domain-containing protein n=1 Tax=Prosthecomicrobium sp. N25 TaxID=3129254 RepID=UPI0030777BD6
MRFALEILLAVIVAVVAGLGSTYLAVGEGWLFRTYRAGEWTAWPEGGSTAPDPYARALIARTAQVPLGAGEGIAFFATRDSNGQPIRGGCEYLLSGETPPARLWTLGVVDAKGDPPAHRSGRTFFTSREVLRRPDGHIEVALSPQARPGNWLPLPDSGALTLILRLYDSPAAIPATAGQIEMPRVLPRGCR